MEQMDKIADDISTIKTDIALIKNDLGHHIKRTDLAERSIELLREEIVPVKTHVARVDGILRFIGLVGIVVGIGSGIYKIFFN